MTTNRILPIVLQIPVPAPDRLRAQHRPVLRRIRTVPPCTGGQIRTAVRETRAPQAGPHRDRDRHRAQAQVQRRPTLRPPIPTVPPSTAPRTAAAGQVVVDRVTVDRVTAQALTPSGPHFISMERQIPTTT